MSGTVNSNGQECVDAVPEPEPSSTVLDDTSEWERCRNGRTSISELTTSPWSCAYTCILSDMVSDMVIDTGFGVQEGDMDMDMLRIARIETEGMAKKERVCMARTDYVPL